MQLKRKVVATILVSLVSITLFSTFSTTANSPSNMEDPFLEVGDVLRYSVTRFNVDFSVFNEEEDNPFEIQDSRILQDSVLYIKILQMQLSKVTFGAGFILGEDSEVGLDPEFDWGDVIDPDRLPETIELPMGAGIPIFGGVFDIRWPFRRNMDPGEFPIVLNPATDWEYLRDTLVDNWEPTRATLTRTHLFAFWQHALRSDEEGIEQATLVWDQETGILVEASLKGQQVIDDKVSPVDIKLAFAYKENINLPAEAEVGYTAEYILTDAYFGHKGLVEIIGSEGIMKILDTIEDIEGEPALLLEITEREGLFYEYNSTIFPGHSEFEEPPVQNGALAFGLGLPVLTPDWEFYTSVWATGDLIINSYKELFEAIRPEQLPLNLDIAQLMLNLKISAEEGYHYYGFILNEEAKGYDPEADTTIVTQNQGEGWLAYEENGLFAGAFITISGAIETEGIAPEQGGDRTIEYEFTFKIEREDIKDGVPGPHELEDPTFTPPPSPEELITTEIVTPIETEEEPEKETTEKSETVEHSETSSAPAAFVPGFDLAVTISALLGLSMIVARSRKRI